LIEIEDCLQRLTERPFYEMSDCEELVEVTHRTWWGWFRRIQHISSIGGFESESSN